MVHEVKADLGIKTEVGNLNNYRGHLLLLVFKLVCLEHLVEVQAVAYVLEEVSLTSKNDNFFVWPIELCLPESLEASVFTLYTRTLARAVDLVSLERWVHFELHVDKHLSKVKVDLVNILELWDMRGVWIFGVDLVDGIEEEVLDAGGLVRGHIVARSSIHQPEDHTMYEFLALARDTNESEVVAEVDESVENPWPQDIVWALV